MTTRRQIVERGEGGTPDGCWPWPASAILRHGYGLVWVEGRYELVHRYSYRVHVGPIPDGLTLDHLCRTRSCWNPAHLEPVTRGENARRGKARISHCPQGHEYTPENTYHYPGRSGRHCRTCTRDRKRRPKENRE